MDASNSFHTVVNCEHEIMKDHCYWPVVSDLINVLSHKKIALKFLQDSDLIELWMELLTDMQGIYQGFQGGLQFGLDFPQM